VPVRKGRRWDRGQTMVEFALVLPFLMLVVFGDVEAHLYESAAAAVDHAASLGVLAAAGASPEHPDQPDISGAYRIAAGQIEAADLKVVQLDPVPQSPGSPTQVCPSPSDRWPTGVMYVCVLWLPQEHAVRVTAEGWLPAFVPPNFGLRHGWRAGALLVTSRHYLQATYYAA